MKQVFGLGRSRSISGHIVGWHLNQYTMCLTSTLGGGWLDMQVLVVEVTDETN